MVIRKIKEVLDFNLPVDMISPSHGVIWRDNPVQIIEKYMEWADNYKENQIILIYDSMWQGTRKMAEAIAEGIKEKENSKIKIFNSAKTDKNDLITEIFKSKAVLIGSSTINNGILYSISGLIEMIKGMKFKNKKYASFGSYGWSGEAVKIINEELKDARYEVVNDGIKELWNPDDEQLERCKEFGRKFAEEIK
jgi:flavorubredoxin